VSVNTSPTTTTTTSSEPAIVIIIIAVVTTTTTTFAATFICYYTVTIVHCDHVSLLWSLPHHNFSFPAIVLTTIFTAMTPHCHVTACQHNEHERAFKMSAKQIGAGNQGTNEATKYV
jgi:hypothetical protein